VPIFSIWVYMYIVGVQGGGGTQVLDFYEHFRCLIEFSIGTFGQRGNANKVNTKSLVQYSIRRTHTHTHTHTHIHVGTQQLPIAHIHTLAETKARTFCFHRRCHRFWAAIDISVSVARSDSISTNRRWAVGWWVAACERRSIVESLAYEPANRRNAGLNSG